MENIEREIKTATQACDDVITTLGLITNAQIPSTEAVILVHLANENNYAIEINKTQVHLTNKANGRRVGVKYLRVSEEAHKWMYGLFVKGSASKVLKFQPTGSFQKEMDAERRRLKGSAGNTIKDNTKIAVIE